MHLPLNRKSTRLSTGARITSAGDRQLTAIGALLMMVSSSRFIASIERSECAPWNSSTMVSAAGRIGRAATANAAAAVKDIAQIKTGRIRATAGSPPVIIEENGSDSHPAKEKRIAD